MKLVREYINEKFSDESDPIKDMGIGHINIHAYIQDLELEDNDEGNFFNKKVYRFLESLRGKTIKGYFSSHFFNNKEMLTFRINKYSFVEKREDLFLYNEKAQEFTVMWDEDYHIS